MSARTTGAVTAVCALLAGLVLADAARAGRLDDAGRALRAPGVWVDRDLSWLVGPQEARRLDRQIDRAKVPVRVAVLPQVAQDESRGDQRAIARAIIRRAGRDGLYVLVDQDGRLEYAASNLPLDLTESSFDRYSGGLRERPLREQLDALVPTVSAAAAAAPVSFAPFADPKGLPTSGGSDHDPLAGVAFACALLGGMLGLGLYFLLRGVVAVTGAWRSRAHG
jgi:hypothetical protein